MPYHVRRMRQGLRRYPFSEASAEEKDKAKSPVAGHSGTRRPGRRPKNFLKIIDNGAEGEVDPRRGDLLGRGQAVKPKLLNLILHHE